MLQNFGVACLQPLPQSLRRVRWAPAFALRPWLAAAAVGGLVWLRDTREQSARAFYGTGAVARPAAAAAEDGDDDDDDILDIDDDDADDEEAGDDDEGGDDDA